jgi:hypothetical protein
VRPGDVYERPIEVLGSPRLNDLKPHPQRLRRDAGRLESVLPGRLGLGIWLQEQGDASHSRDDLLQQFQRLTDELRRDEGRTRDIAAGPSQTGDQPLPYRVASRREDDGQRCRRLLGG